MQKVKVIVLVKDVGKFMISIVLLGILAVVDFIKKEISICILLPVIVIWLSIAIWNNEIEIQGIIAVIFLVALSLFTKQAFGMADAIVLSLIAVTKGVFNMLMIFFTANILFLIFAVVRNGMKQRNTEFPFIPFIFIIFIFAKILFKEGI